MKNSDIEYRNTFKYKGYDITVRSSQHTPSNLEFLIPDRSKPNSYFTLAYFDEVEDLISVGLDWNKYRELHPEKF